MVFGSLRGDALRKNLQAHPPACAAADTGYTELSEERFCISSSTWHHVREG